MQLSRAQIEKLKTLLQEETGHCLSDQELYIASVAVIRFVLGKELQNVKNNKEVPDGLL